MVSLHGNRYEVDPALVGRRVQLVFDPFDLDALEVRFDGRDFGDRGPARTDRPRSPQGDRRTARRPRRHGPHPDRDRLPARWSRPSTAHATRRTINFADLDDVQEGGR